VTVRPARHADIPQLVALMREFYAESSYPLETDWAARAFERLLNAPSLGAVWLIEDEGSAIGHVVLTVRFAMEVGGLWGSIDDLFVQPACRRRGAATAALDAVVAECHRRGCLALSVEVGADNHAAIALYRRFGLVPGDDGRLMLRRVTLSSAARFPCDG
jgi:ribosomal protein S18 acetylase RimI-like enzyme